jgi:hypothetical protein
MNRAAPRLAGEAAAVNGQGIFADPAQTLIQLRAAEALLRLAITRHTITSWPSPADYHAL